MKKIRIGIVGYGNIGQGAEKAVLSATDMELRAVFSRRDAKTLKLRNELVPVYDLDAAEKMAGEIDAMILCGGSSTDLQKHGPRFAALFNTVDSYDTHAKIPEYLKAVDAAAKKTTAVISAGWDPGLFSILRVLSSASLPDGEAYTFWGRGVSQGHSVAIRQVEGVRYGIQYSVPIEEAVEAVRSGARPVLGTRDKHHRECYVVAEQGADKSAIEHAIKTMPDYFADYDTTVTFISEDEFLANHTKMPHGGNVLYSGNTGKNKHLIEFSLKLESNPEFTGSIVAAYARAAYRMAEEGMFGAKTVLDIPMTYLSETPRETLIKEML